MRSYRLIRLAHPAHGRREFSRRFHALAYFNRAFYGTPPVDKLIATDPEDNRIVGACHCFGRLEHFVGAESVRKHGNPEGGVHSLQIEINRSLYMDEDRYRRGDKFETVCGHLDQLIGELADFARGKAR